MFPGFERGRHRTSETEIAYRKGGEGPPLLLLHGYPQTHVMWHRTAPTLAQHFTVVAADLRGYGDSGKPERTDCHTNYSKRVMANDQVELMAGLGFDRFSVVGHDRGARVAHRMALDHAGRLEKVAVLDIAPTLTMYENTDMAFARAYYHWFFLIQPFDLPERLIGADPGYYLERKLAAWSRRDGAFAPEAVAEYKRCFADPATIRATCEDYRAAASIDLEHDRADRDRKVIAPLLVLWGGRGVVAATYDVLATWREKAENVRGRALDCGHFLPEEEPEETLKELLAFL
ncbi:MAG: alpha/beta hydrolase [Kiloniellales bacterium]|nr:alpha/beta hydrolase [Kiloniellales bacterium]